MADAGRLTYNSYYYQTEARLSASTERKPPVGVLTALR